MMFASLETHCRLAPRGARAVVTNRGAAFATAVRVIAGVHNHTANRRTHAHVALSSCFTDRNVLMIEIADLTDRSAAENRNHANLAAGQANLREPVFLSHQLRRIACGTNHLAALSRMKLDVMNHSTNRDKL